MEKLRVQLICLKIKVLSYSVFFSHFIFIDAECFNFFFFKTGSKVIK